MNLLKKQVRKILLILAVFCSSINVMGQSTNIDYTRLIKAIGTVESGLNDNAVNGPHAGFLQIAGVCVAECNRINKKNNIPDRYTLKDRFNRQKSIEMFYIIQNFYNNKKDMDYDTRIKYAILLWNEGCSAMNKPIRKTRYYNKVMSIYEKI